MPRLTFRLAALLALAVAPSGGALADNGLVGAYLAARQASGTNDYRAAAEYYTKALVRDPANPLLLESALVAQFALGNFEAALPIATRLDQSGATAQLDDLALLADALAREDYAAVFAAYDAGRSIGPLVDGLVKAWAHLAQGDADKALAGFDSVAATAALAPFALYHKALALALVGDFEGAERIFAGEAGAAVPPTRRGLIAHAQILGQLERGEDALTLLDATFGADPDPAVAALRARFQAGEAPPFDVIAAPRDGLAEVFYTVAGALNGEAEGAYTLIYSRIAELLAPKHAEAVILSASLLEGQKQYDLATEAYDRIGRDDPYYYLAELGRADALRSAGRVEAAIEVLKQLAKAFPAIPDVHRALGDILRAEDLFDESSKAYDAAIAALPVEDASHWVLYYVRGITHERSGRWDAAEADFRKALSYEPNQPQVLNYLGYSFLEKGGNYDEALEMIERAVAARPEDGYIVDSLGWALYRLGRYEEAVPQMEKAAELAATDPTVNDHLGDVYWAVGRHLEAAFQWRRALSFIRPGEAESADIDPDRIRRKIEKGLDAVLAAEGAKPLAVANDGGG